MNGLKTLNLAIQFFLELCMLAAIGYWGFKTQSSWGLKIILGIGLPLLLIVIWGLFLAPRAAYPLRGLPNLAAKLILLGSGAVALFATGHPGLGWTYAIILVLSDILALVWNQ